jgi:putative transposase
VDFTRELAKKTELSERRIVSWLDMARGKYFEWVRRYGKANEHNALVPRDTWLLPEERQAILDFHERNPLDGYRRLAFMMTDADIVAVSPSTVYRVLHGAGRLDRWSRRPSKKGTGFQAPERPHQHWHIDIAYLNLGGTFYYFCGVLDGFSRASVHREIRESMTEAAVEPILQRARERYPYPQSNGKMERFNKTLRTEAIRVSEPETLAQAVALVTRFIDHYNAVRLHSAIDYIAPHDMRAGRHDAILAERDRRLEAAGEIRRQRRQSLRESAHIPEPVAA